MTPPVLIEVGVEDEGLERGIRVTGGRGDALDRGVEQFGDAFAGLGTDAQDVAGRDAEHLLDLRRVAVGVGSRQVDLVEGGHDLQVVLDGQVAVGQRLGLDALGRVHQQDHALAAASERDLVAEVDVSGGVDQVEDVVLPGHPHVLGLDGDAPLPLDVHRVEVLGLHVPGVDRTGQLQDAVCERGLPVVDVGQEAEGPEAGEV